MSARRTVAAGASALCALGLAACLEVKPEEPTECKTTADCDAGEVCEENVCWGNPPPGPFAALVSAPSARSGDLVSRELLALPISGDGWLDDVHLEQAVAYKGTLEAQCQVPLDCAGRVGASIVVTRRSSFHGGPGFRKQVTVKAGEGFELDVPATQPGEPKYTVTVIPDGRDAPSSMSSLARLVPPLRTELEIPMSSSNNLLVLGAPDLPRVTGTVITSLSAPLTGYRVVALGRWDPKEPVTEVSTVDVTGPLGAYSIFLSKGLAGPVEIVARPVMGASLRPELHLGSVPSDRDSLGKQLQLPVDSIGLEVPAQIIVVHQEANGETTKVVGARVLVSGVIPAGTNATARLITEGTTDDHGSVSLKLLDLPELAQSYRISIIPPPSSPAAALYQEPFKLLPLTTRRLETRLSMVGKVVSADERELADVLVTARPSLRFLWNLEPELQAFVGAIPAATTTTSITGEFVVFVDQVFTGASPVWGHYDLTFEPAKPTFPSWTVANIELPRDASATTQPTGTIRLPDGAHVRGVVVDDGAARLADADVKLFRVQTDLGVCSETRFEPQDCPIPALLVSRGATDKDGIVRLTLPR